MAQAQAATQQVEEQRRQVEVAKKVRCEQCVWMHGLALFISAGVDNNDYHGSVILELPQGRFQLAHHLLVCVTGPGP
jgi:hypothetical protein